MEVIFLGTGSMVPTKKRNHSGILVSYKNENILIDCGEGTQRQLRIGNMNPMKITKILITHWHGDHVLGLPGLLQTLEKGSYNKILEIYGPKRTKEFLNNMFKSFYWGVNFKIKVKEIEGGKFFENEDFILEAKELIHGIPCLGYSFIEKDKRNIEINYIKKFGLEKDPILKKLKEGKNIKWNGKTIDYKLATKIKRGKKVSFILDTAFCKNAIKLSKDSDVIICEATLAEYHKEKAEKYQHLTGKMAGEIAKSANAEKLVLTHFSQRYKEIKGILEETKKIFKNTYCAEDFLKIKI